MVAAHGTPQGGVLLEVIEDLPKAGGLEAGGLPEFRRRGFEECVGIEGIGLGMRALGEIEAEAGSDERAAGLRVGIGGEDPAFVTAIAEEVHQIRKAELHVGGAEVEERMDGVRECGCGFS
jgi:hypothetical protein